MKRNYLIKPEICSITHRDSPVVRILNFLRGTVFLHKFHPVHLEALSVKAFQAARHRIPGGKRLCPGRI